MAIGQSSPLSGQQEAKEVQARLRLLPAAYASYCRRVEGFLSFWGSPASKWTYPGKHIRRFRTLRSRIFGREYLVACASPAWFRRSFPATDAIAAQEVSIGGLPSPPLVIVPESKRIASTIEARSIIEHEFVHIAQMLRGVFPGAPQGTPRDLLNWMFDATRAEYEANLLQLTRWPQLYAESGAPKHMSLENWCVFRGFTQSLERIVSDSINGRFSKGAAGRVFRELPSALPRRFRRMGFDVRLGQYCASRMDAFVATACRNLAAEDPDFNRRLLALRKSWSTYFHAPDPATSGKYRNWKKDV